ncbi:SDR family oxidoreductase [Goodfellowiella coeruleoviolacea]|uniref:NADP-dependent 3-hydroxy acid dehydrogenase YdfG n=1 Tax=Goodfellowiella coeruleoviolacea TaxID=334858 RepID=A0AAE3KIQ7_9PSEU|nr:SDR family oxidoreductase [Goodfellowiella coeruleoviolacea]MCP2168710.1 NADP-dependent 3-hydroxy acid dehydrogenase YdfG [Goodfellowiella coeruleoviolacea]
MTNPPAAGTVLVTGASRGIGRATALLFEERGWNVVATMRRPEDEQELGDLDRVLVTRLDVTDSGSITAAVRAGVERFGGIDVLVNNAGYGVYGPLEATPMDTVRRLFDTNVIGLLETTKAVLPLFRARRSGVIVNLSSVGGRMTFPLGTLYHGSKFAIEGASEALSFELAEVGVRVKIVEPGVVRTDFGRTMDIPNDERLVEFQEIIRNVFTAFAPITEQAAEPALVAEVIYRAATDGTDQLRYLAGPDAEETIARREAQDDQTFLAGIRDQFVRGDDPA